MSARLSILGAGGSSPPPGYAGPSLLLDSGGARLLLDCGEGCVERLRSLGYSPCEVDAVYITHSHHDHWAGVTSLAVARVEEGCRDIRIYLHKRVAEELRVMIELLPGSVNPRTDIVEEGFKVEDIRVALVEVSHTRPTYGALVEAGGSSVLYTSDTRLDERLFESLSRLSGVDVLVVEATLPSGREDVARETGHMTVGQALELISKLEPRLAIPVHLTPLSLRQLRAYRLLPRNLIIPVDGVTVTL